MRVIDVQYSPIIRKAGLVIELTGDEYKILSKIAYRIGYSSVRDVIKEALQLYMGKNIDKIFEELRGRGGDKC